MRFWKRTLFMVITLMVLSSYCLAAMPRTIPPEEIAIGGIHVSDSEDFVRSVYGEPDNITYSADPVFGNKKTFDYGGSFFITFHYYHDRRNDVDVSHVIYAKSTANNGLKTPPGFAVGSPFINVIKYYGNDWSNVKKENGKRAIIYWEGEYRIIKYQATAGGKIESIAIYDHG